MNNANLFSKKELDVTALKQLHKNWNWYFMLGIGLILLGSLAVVFSIVTTLVSVIYLGIFLMVLGFFEFAKCLKIDTMIHFFLHLFLGILYIVGGFYIAKHPAVNALTLTLLLAIFFIVGGILRIIFGFSKNLPHRGWILFNGVITLLLGIMIWKQWPYSGLWVIGLLVGIDTIFSGWSWIMLSLYAKNLKVTESNTH